jgi:hypothetical protein
MYHLAGIDVPEADAAIETHRNHTIGWLMEEHISNAEFVLPDLPDLL